ncbi:hypothetical protein [Bacillus toyonensis]|uniref:hypothetical protein n=1 Tax=Bacillus toyonensis TaxID=155322 RepID=UPI0015CF4C0B|nr:hypothetical protein [Bacillus toyonensis]
MECSHVKEYSNYVLMSDPAKVIWKCKKCGENGKETYKAVGNRLVIRDRVRK